MSRLCVIFFHKAFFTYAPTYKVVTLFGRAPFASRRAGGEPNGRGGIFVGDPNARFGRTKNELLPLLPP